MERNGHPKNDFPSRLPSRNCPDESELRLADGQIRHFEWERRGDNHETVAFRCEQPKGKQLQPSDQATKIWVWKLDFNRRTKVDPSPLIPVMILKKTRELFCKAFHEVAQDPHGTLITFYYGDHLSTTSLENCRTEIVEAIRRAANQLVRENKSQPIFHFENDKKRLAMRWLLIGSTNFDITMLPSDPHFSSYFRLFDPSPKPISIPKRFVDMIERRRESLTKALTPKAETNELALADRLVRLAVLSRIVAQYHENLMRELEPLVRDLLQNDLPPDADEKRLVCSCLNQILSENGIAIQSPDTGKPCFINVTVTATMPQGYFLLQERTDRSSGKSEDRRRRATKATTKLAPLVLMHSHHPDHLIAQLAR